MPLQLAAHLLYLLYPKPLPGRPVVAPHSPLTGRIKLLRQNTPVSPVARGGIPRRGLWGNHQPNPGRRRPDEALMTKLQPSLFELSLGFLHHAGCASPTRLFRQSNPPLSSLSPMAACLADLKWRLAITAHPKGSMEKCCCGLKGWVRLLC